MGRKVFISYKYADTQVQDLGIYEDSGWGLKQKVPTKVRHYVDKLQEEIGKDNINLGEKDGESLAEFSDTTIETELKGKIRQCSITIILLSKGMKTDKPEKEQWIPWEVSYSLRAVSNDNYSKQMNAILGVVLPDETGSYDWYYKSDLDCNCTTHYTSKLFKILRNNSFNIKDKQVRQCNGKDIYTNDEPSFFKTVKWDEFMRNHNYYIEKAIKIKNNKDAYDVHINLD